MVDSDIARLHMFVSGRVQGVFFRGTVADEARSLGLTGWARNLADGRVEIVAEGKRANLRTLEAWAHQGPPSDRHSIRRRLRRRHAAGRDAIHDRVGNGRQ